jgi:hypothetical protein
MLLVSLLLSAAEHYQSLHCRYQHAQDVRPYCCQLQHLRLLHRTQAVVDRLQLDLMTRKHPAAVCPCRCCQLLLLLLLLHLPLLLRLPGRSWVQHHCCHRLSEAACAVQLCQSALCYVPQLQTESSQCLSLQVSAMQHQRSAVQAQALVPLHVALHLHLL